jgi:hypothetical protein
VEDESFDFGITLDLHDSSVPFISVISEMSDGRGDVKRRAIKIIS